MQTAAGLLAYAALLGWLVDAALARSRWVRRHPGPGLWLWHGVALGAMAAVGAAMFLLAHDIAEHGFVWGLHADKALVHDAYASPSEIPAIWNATLIPLSVGFALLAISTVRLMRAAREESRAHRLGVEFRRPVAAAGGHRLLVGVRHSAVPAIYCVARGSSDERILATTGALRLLDESQLQAAVEHERAHVAAHHHAMSVLAGSITHVARWLGMLRNYQRAVRTLMELQADDVAASHHGRTTVAAALLQLGAASSPTVPPTAASLDGDDVAARIRRLLDDRARPVPGLARLMALAAAAVLLAVPAATSLVPAISLAGTASTTETAPSGTPEFVHHR